MLGWQAPPALKCRRHVRPLLVAIEVEHVVMFGNRLLGKWLRTAIKTCDWLGASPGIEATRSHLRSLDDRAPSE